MRSDDPLTPEDRVHELAGIFAAAILRLHIRGALQAARAPQNLLDSSSDCLELPPEAVLSVHTG
jgi:hypothetical protein